MPPADIRRHQRVKAALEHAPPSEVDVERVRVHGEGWRTVAKPVSGGSLPDGSVLPVAHSSGATVDTTTYDDSLLGVGKLTTLVFPAKGPGEDWGLLAIAFEGEAFPRVIVSADPTVGTFMGDGTVQPLNNGAAQWIEASSVAGEFVHVIEGGGATQLRVGMPDPNTARRISIAGGLTFGQGAPGDMQILAAGGDPNTNRGGNVGDLFFRSDPGGANQTIYRCTVAGTAGNATWVGIL